MPPIYKLAGGTAGAVYVGPQTGGDPTGSTVTMGAVAELSKWTMTVKVTPIKAANFGSGVDAAGNVFPAVYKGLAEGQVEVEGQYDVTLASSSGLKIVAGKYYYLNLLIDKSQPFGYKNVYALCTASSADVNVENQVSKFTASFEISSDTSGTSTPPAPGSTT